MRATTALWICHTKANLAKAIVFSLLVCLLGFGNLLLPANTKVAHAATCTVTGTIMQINPNLYVEHAFIHRVPLSPARYKSIKAAYYVNGAIRLNISVWTIWVSVAGQRTTYIDFWVFSRYRGAYPYIGNGTKTLVEYTC